MPMRGELAIPMIRPDGEAATERDAWAVLGFCLIGFLFTIYAAVSSGPLDQIPLLVAQANLW